MEKYFLQIFHTYKKKTFIKFIKRQGIEKSVLCLFIFKGSMLL